MTQRCRTYTVLEKALEKRYTLGVVYEPDAEDTQGDFMKAADIEASAWDFMERLQLLAKSCGVILTSAIGAGREGITLDVTNVDELIKGEGLDDQHLQLDEPLGVIVESYVAPADFTVNGEPIKKGTWLLGVRWTQEMFEKIKKGERTGLSLYGTADRVKEKAVA